MVYLKTNLENGNLEAKYNKGSPKTKKAKREYLNEPKTTDLMKKLSAYFESKVDVPRIKFGKTQTIETLINEEALLFAKFLRHEREAWIPRVANL